MKRLFALKEVASGVVVNGEYFNNKMIAKEERNKLNTAAGHVKYAVTKGPDHNDVLNKTTDKK